LAGGNTSLTPKNKDVNAFIHEIQKKTPQKHYMLNKLL
jgi:hypothetical protein